VDVRTSGEAYDMKRKISRVDREPEIARLVSNCARKELAARGFSIAESRPVFRFSGSNAIEPLSPAWRPFLTAAEAKAYEKREEKQPSDDRLELDVFSLFQTQPDADAWLLIFTEGHFENFVVPRTKGRNTEAKVAAAVAGSIILTVLTGNPELITVDDGSIPAHRLPSWTRHAFVLVDPATGEILWSRWLKFNNEDPRSDRDIEGTTRKVLGNLPTLK
jgi:hypothetical protein